jgi:ATP-dependent DNA helicase RecQ
LKLWRKTIAAENKVPAYVIFHDTTLNDLAERKPVNEQQILQIQGMGQIKFERFGAQVLDIINKFGATSKVEKRTTFEITFQLYEQGLTIEEMSVARQLSENTIYGHLAKLFEEGKPVDLNKFVSEYEVNQVKSIRKKLSNTNQLKPIYEALDGKLDYRKIGLALSVLSRYA